MSQPSNEMDLLVSRGLVDREAVPGLLARARDEAVSPLELLYEDGALSEETLAVLQREIDSEAFDTEATTDGGRHDRMPEAEPGMPARWQRFEIRGVLGKGGMGRVYRAFDPLLKREVALKLPGNLHPEFTERFVREARAQAHVEHPHIAKIYEAGSLDGQPYIAMQLVEGRQLQRAVEEMSLEQTLLTFAAVADGVHEAHRSGLVHRDLKPANILVAHAGGGGFHPYVLDFGLARLDTDQELTVEGDLLGTPVYMAPEQVRGEIAALDRRTDVYGLGATLYRILTGRPPHEAPSRVVLLNRILEATPVPPRTLRKSLPRDVETIVLKCLEKRPQDRYPSARAFAEDLRRYLDGEPIEARPARWWYPLAKKLIKHRLIVGTVVVAVLALAASLAWGSYRAAHRARLTAHLMEQVDAVEASVRHSHMAPLHDVRPDRARLRARMDNIAGDLRVGGAMRGPGNYALGWGMLHLGDPRTALTHLEAAWESGYRDPRVAYALGIALGRMFQAASAELHAIEDGPAREAMRGRLKQTYRDPALDYLRAVRPSEVMSPVWLNAYMAYLEERYADALALLGALEHDLPWFYEAHTLEGDLLRDWAWSDLASGDEERARTRFQNALAAYDRAADIARSDPEIYKARLATYLHMLNMNLFEDAAVVDGLVQDALGQAQTALTALPEDGETLLLEAQIYAAQARRDRLVSGDADAGVARSVALVAAAREAGADPVQSALVLARAYRQWAEMDVARKEDPSARVEAGLAALADVPAAGRHAQYYTLKARLHMARADWRKRQGEDTCKIFDEADEAFRAALALEPHNAAVSFDLAVILAGRVLFAQCPEHRPVPVLHEMIDLLEKARGLRPGFWLHDYYLGFAHRRLAEGGGDQMDFLDEDLAATAVRYYEQALVHNPGRDSARGLGIYNELATMARLRGRRAERTGADPVPYYEEAAARNTQALAIAPNHRALLQNRAWAYYDQAKFLCRTGRDGAHLLDAAEADTRAALQHGEALQGLLCLGSIYRIRAETASGDAVAPLVARAAAHFGRILEINPHFTEAHCSLGRLYTEAAAAAAAAGRDPAPLLEQARLALDAADEQAPTLPRNLAARARWYVQCRAAGMGPVWPPDGLEAALAEAFAANAQATDLGLLHAALRGHRANAAGDRAAYAAARTAFQHLLDGLPLWRAYWAPSFPPAP